MASGGKKIKRIVLLPSAYYPLVGGVQEICRNLSTILQDRSYEVVIVVHKDPADVPDVEFIDGIEVRRFDFYYPNRSVKGVLHSVRSMKGYLSFAKWLKEWRPDLIHVICPSSSSLYLWATRSLGDWLILVTFQGEIFMDADQIYQRSFFAKWALSQLLKVTDGVTACSSYVLKHAKTQFSVPQAINSIVFNGVDLSEPVESRPDLPSRKYILGIGRLVNNKGFDDLLKAFKIVTAENDEIDLVIAGGGDALDELIALARQLGLSERVKFLDWQPRPAVTALFNACQFFVLPSPVEPFGIVCLEAMRAAKAIIATDAGGPPEFLSDGQDCVLVPPRNPELLASAMDELLRDPQRMHRLGLTGRERVSKFAWPLIADQYETIYQQLSSLPAERAKELV